MHVGSKLLRFQVSGFRLEGSWLGTYEAIPFSELLYHFISLSTNLFVLALNSVWVGVVLCLH
jgi:hypothetical protein